VEATVATAERSVPDTADPPRAIGSGEPQDREALGAVELRSIPRPSRLEAPISSLRGAGPKLSAAATRIEIETLGDLLAHVPHSYRDRSEVTPIGELPIGTERTIEVEVRSSHLRRTRRRNLKIVEATVRDESGTTKAVWFNQAWLADRLEPGTRWLLSGKLDRNGFRVSDFEALANGGIHTTGIVPVHPATEGLSAKKLRDWAWQALPLAREEGFRGRATLSRRHTSPTISTRSRRRASDSRSRSSSSIRSPWPCAAAAASATAPGFPSNPPAS
jgi:RecG-like helicase